LKLLDPGDWTPLSFDWVAGLNEVRWDMSVWAETPALRLGVLVVVLGLLIAAGFYLVSIFRDYSADDQDEAAKVLANLEEMHRRGDISDQEFRSIQASTHRPPAGSRSPKQSTTMDDCPPNRTT
jgi:hypothetical protein